MGVGVGARLRFALVLLSLLCGCAAVCGGTSAPSRAQRSHRDPVPILMYHVINRAPPRAPYPNLYVEPGNFALQMRWLARHGFHGVTLRQVFNYWTRGTALPSKPIVLSFDDGYRTIYSRAFPILRALRWPGVVNLKVGNTTVRSGLPPAVVRTLIAAGWEIDSHTFSHPDLTAVGNAQLQHEVAGSRGWIRRHFHVPVDFFCYPSGRYDARVLAAVRAAGYLGATTTEYGLARPSEPLTLDRIRVNGSDSVGTFASKLS